MKRFFIVFLIISVTFCLVNCGTEKVNTEKVDYVKIGKYESLHWNSTNDGMGLHSEVNFWESGFLYKKDYVLPKSITFKDITYRGTYNGSRMNRFYSYTTDYYNAENGISFGLKADTGDLVYLNLTTKDYTETEPYLDNINAPYETAIEIATTVAREFTNLDEYTQIIEAPQTKYYEKDGKTYELTTYNITFVRIINGYSSTDSISVIVNSKGNICSITLGDLNAFQNIDLDFDVTQLEKSIYTKLNNEYKEIHNLTLKHFDYKSQQIVLSPNNDICIFSDIEVFVVDESNQEFDTIAAIVTGIGEK